MIYIMQVKNKNIVKTALDYNTRHKLNFNELCLVMEMKEEKLENYLTTTKNSYIDTLDEIVKKQINEILNSKSESVDKKKTLVAKFEYAKEMKIITDFNDLIRRCDSNNNNYKFTDKDYEIIGKYKKQYQLSNLQLQQILGVNRKHLNEKISSKNIPIEEFKSMGEYYSSKYCDTPIQQRKNK